MGPLDAINHLVNFLMPALCMAVLLPALARLVWWRTLRGVAWWPQVGWLALVNSAVLVVGLLVLGRDGAMITYGGLVLASAATVWWTSLRGKA